MAALDGAGEPPRRLRVLFIGNSLTYANDLPRMVERLGAADGYRIETKTIASPNYALEDHLNEPHVQRAAREPWDFVVLQQGPSSLPESRAALIRDTKAIARMFASRPSTKIALLMVWPAQEHARSWDRVSESYLRAATATNGILIPAGERLRAALRQNPSSKLLAADGFHPTEAGTHIAALATYRAITGRARR